MNRHSRARLGFAVLLGLATAGCKNDHDAADASTAGSDARVDAGARDSGQPGPDAGRDAGAGPDAALTEYQICVQHINALRATKSRPAYSRWSSAETCVDGQATSDEQASDPHGAFGECGESGQNECLGGEIVSCLDSMWAEKDQAGCSGCDACADAYNPSCPNCDFYGTETGDVCGHYVNLSARYFTQAACGFSSTGSWAAIDFR
jgi:hypothetical protein